jgi:RecA/RadA recombinase
MIAIRQGLTTPERVIQAMSIVSSSKIEVTKTEKGYVGRLDNHVVRISEDGSVKCSCGDKKLCKHAIAVLLKLPEDFSTKILENLLKEAKTEAMKYISTGIKNLDELVHIPHSGVIGVFGPPKVGKTLLVTQILYKISGDLKAPALYVDTEGFYTPDAIAKSLAMFSKRFSEGKVEFMTVRTLESLLKLLGLSLTLEFKEKKLDTLVAFELPPDEVPLMKMIKMLNASALAIDSFTMPIKRVFGSFSQNLPARSAIINAMFARLEEIASAAEIPIFITHHAGKSPVNPYDPYKPYGGLTLLYNLKHILLLLPAEKNERRIVRYTWPYQARDETTVKLVDGHGYE